ncbi:MAG TPA: tetratricopeptide repeat protein [Candidatus Limnocylindrales bacterium]|nr:tetratricopeptide repeat protein [Candidatus Limnocylindrales bacterium]
MSEALYERYKDALRRGHVAALRGRLDAALIAYGEAADIAPERALPHASLGAILHRLGRDDDALTAFGHALDRASRDEAALTGRAEILAGRGDRVRAAESFDQLAEALAAAGRVADACDAARRALELAESRQRRRLVRDLVEQLRGSPADAPVIAALERALGVLEPTSGEAGPLDAAPAEAAPVDAAPADSVSAEAAAQDAAADDAVVEDDGSGSADATAADGVVLADEAEAALDAGDVAAARDGWLRAAGAHRRVGHRDAALDACYLALSLAPDDPELHLALAELYVEQGWRTHAADKLVLLARLAELNGDPTTRARLCAIAADHVPDDLRLREICA